MKVLLVNQTYCPDSVASGQYAGELARALVEDGHNVTVLTGRRAYDRPWVQFSPRELRDGVDIIRVPYTGFGKGVRWRRAMDFGSFLLSSALRLLRLPKFDVVISMSSPPLLATVASAIVRLRGGELICWVLDLNPDEAIAAGWLREGTRICRLLQRLTAYGFAHARNIVVMDRFMARRVMRYGVPQEKIAVIPPWSNNGSVQYDRAGRDEFRHEHGLEGRFVVMYSGNHSPCHPLETLLEAARRMKNDHKVVFCFVGGGSEFSRVKAYAAGHRLRNILCLPYVPMSSLSASLSSADLHAVVMGDPYLGIVHTCKVYNILALGIPFLYIGPEQSHITDLGAASFTSSDWMMQARHGDPETVVNLIRQAAAAKLAVPCATEQELARDVSQEALMPLMFEVLHRTGDHATAAVCAAPPHSS